MKHVCTQNQGTSNPAPATKTAGGQHVVAGCHQSALWTVERLCADVPTERIEELVSMMRGWGRIYRSQMQLQLLTLETLDYLVCFTRKFISDTATSPGEKLVAIVSLNEIEREIVRREKAEPSQEILQPVQ